MPPKATQSSQQGGPKQTSLLGFFSKPATTSSGDSNRLRPPATPASVHARATSSTSKVKSATSTSKDAAEKRRQAIQAATQSSPTANIKTLASSDARENGGAASEGKSITNENGKTRRTESNGNAIGTRQQKPQDKVDSDVFLGSSPLSAVDVLNDDEEQAIVEPEVCTEAGKEQVDGKAKETSKSEDEATVDVEMTNGEERAGARKDAGEADEDEDEDDQPVRSSVSDLYMASNRASR